MTHHTTRGAARLLATAPNNLTAAIWRGRLAAPVKDEGGRYLWSPEDIERARLVLATDRRRKVVPA